MYDCTAVQGATFDMHCQLYHGHANTMALSSSPVVSALTGGPSSSCEMIILHNNSHGGMDLFTIPSPILDMQPHTRESEAGADSC